MNLGFLTRQNPDVSDVSELRDVRLAVIDELKKSSRVQRQPVTVVIVPARPLGRG